MIQKVHRFIAQHDLIPPGGRVLAAVSGGSDSVGLAHLLSELQASGALHLCGLVHFNHQLRAAADDDERFVRSVAERLGQRFFTARGDVAARARDEHRSIESAARAARYEWFERARQQSGADVVALGHTRDDQAETVLLRLMRGAGPRGLSGMHPRNGRLVRPLLECRRSDLRAWLEARHLAFVEDESNFDVAIVRNRVRGELIPMLAARFNPSIIDVLADHADLARGISDWMSGEALALESRALIHAGVEPGGGIVRELDAAVLLAAPIALQRVVLWRMLAGVGRAGAITFGHVEGARRLLADGGAADFPAHRAERIAGSLVLTGRPAGTRGRRARPAANLFEYSLSIPGEIVVPDTGVVSVEAAPRAVVSSASGCAAAVRADMCGTTLIVRNRRPGDRFRPAGLAGRKKLQDYFVDRKIARDRRDAVPIVVDEKGRIIWVAGHAIDEAFRVTDPAQPVLLLKFKALGGSA